MTDGPSSWRSFLGATLLCAFFYLALGTLSFSTAYVATNTAAVWIPSGYAVGLIVAQGYRCWPAIALGSAILNTLVIATAHDGVSLGLSIAIALPIALGNAGEAVLGGYLAQKFAAGPAFLSRPRNVSAFALLVVPLAPLVSMSIGVLASHIGGSVASGTLLEVMLTWYVANAIGILVFTAPVVLALTKPASHRRCLTTGGLLEALLLAGCLVFASQAICGFYLGDWLRAWPKTYMITPLLFWASFRFGTVGAVLAILIVTIISVIGTMRGFAAFPAETPSRSLIYLQVFLGTVSIMTLFIAAGLTENWDLQANLEDKVQARTREVQRHLREREVFTTMVAHDLQSPIYGVRNALRAASDAIETDRISRPEIVAALAVMEDTCSTLAERVASLLVPHGPGSPATPTESRVKVATILRKIASAHRHGMDSKAASLRILGDATADVRMPSKVEHILDILVDNAIKFSPHGSSIDIATTVREDVIEICVTDYGRGVAAAEIPRLFYPRTGTARNTNASGVGLGLSLALGQARALGGDLSYSAVIPKGSQFCLTLPT